MRLAMYIVGQEETVGESSVSSGCWGEDSDHTYGWARRTPTFVALIRFLPHLPLQSVLQAKAERQAIYRLRAFSNYHSLGGIDDSDNPPKRGVGC